MGATLLALHWLFPTQGQDRSRRVQLQADLEAYLVGQMHLLAQVHLVQLVDFLAAEERVLCSPLVGFLGVEAVQLLQVHSKTLPTPVSLAVSEAQLHYSRLPVLVFSVVAEA